MGNNTVEYDSLVTQATTLRGNTSGKYLWGYSDRRFHQEIIRWIQLRY
jgi:hypothetical protein